MTTRPVSRVDLNRTGVPLMEIVSEPDMRTPGGSRRLPKAVALHRTLPGCERRQPGRGQLSLRRQCVHHAQGSDTLGTRAELKNLNSFKHVEKAIAFEISRQKEIVMDGGTGRSGNPALGPGQKQNRFHARQGRRP
jgi:aspartyl-tRNA(Asn)/glutamyl-tRNA(Gln) amidotransferase subunit B